MKVHVYDPKRKLRGEPEVFLQLQRYGSEIRVVIVDGNGASIWLSNLIGFHVECGKLVFSRFLGPNSDFVRRVGSSGKIAEVPET